MAPKKDCRGGLVGETGRGGCQLGKTDGIDRAAAVLVVTGSGMGLIDGMGLPSVEVDDVHGGGGSPNWDAMLRVVVLSAPFESVIKRVRLNRQQPSQNKRGCGRKRG
jgi:hypothetical protein